MARNEEKAQAMLNKWVTMKKEIGLKQKGTDRRPYLASECSSLNEAEKWRRQIIRETTKKVAEIQNAGMGEHRIRDLNDNINKLLRERIHWERRIVDLGGPNYTQAATVAYDADGRELPGGGGYKYFGAARDLPGVRELFQKSEQQAPRRTRGDMYKNITPDYYGYRDDEDSILAIKELESEKKRLEEALILWKANRDKRVDKASEIEENESEDEDVQLEVQQKMERMMKSREKSALTDATVTAHVPVISQDDIKAGILAKKKAMLLEKLQKEDD